MKIINVTRKIIAGLLFSIRRFPIAVLMSAATAVTLIIINELQPTASQSTIDILRRLSMIFALGIPLALCVKHFFERYVNIRSGYRIMIYSIGAALLALYYYLLLPELKMVPVTRYIAVSAALYIIFILLPYFYRREHFELYAIKLFIRFLVTLLYSGVLFAGLSAILFTIDRLLQIHVYDKMYLYVWITIAGVFAPCFFLGGIPSYGQDMDKSDYSKLLKILLLYIVMPLISAYTVILYIYFAKIIITFSWPQGLVAHLVLWYSVISAAVIFMTSPLKEADKWVRTFISLFIKLVLPILIIMFISIGIRIKAYGVTENRYFVVVLGAWVTGIFLYLNFSKLKRSMVMPVSLAIIALLSVFGPWSAYTVSMSSQNSRLESLLSKNDMLKNGTIVKAGATVSENDKKEMSSILYYFSNSHSLKDVRYLPKDFSFQKMEDTFGFPLDQYSPSPAQGYFSYNLKMLEEPIDIKGYDYLFSFQDFQQPKIMKKDSLEVRYDNKETTVTVLTEGKEIYKYKLMDFVRKLYEAHKSSDKSEIALTDMTFMDGNDKIEMKYVINNVYGNVDTQTGEITVQGVNYHVMLRLK